MEKYISPRLPGRFYNLQGVWNIVFFLKYLLVFREDIKASINPAMTVMPVWYKATSHFIRQNKGKSTITTVL